MRVAPALILAPMSGVTDSPFRRTVLRASGTAVGMVVSEFISVELLTARQLRSFVRLSFHPSERPVAVQLYGADVAKMAEAARMVEDAGADLIDINAGCPAPKIVRRGGGAGLLRDLPRLGRILEAVSAAVSIPATVKIRNGWSDQTLNAHETLKVAEQSGAKALAIHGRTREQLYRGRADWEVVAALKADASIPILGSGDVVRASDAPRRLAESGCDGVMIGRAAITNPWIFRQIDDHAAGRAVAQPTWAQTFDLLEGYLQMLLEHYPRKVAPGRMKMMLSRLLKGFHAEPAARRTCLRMERPEQMLAYLRETSARLGVLDAERDACAAALGEAAAAA